MNDNGYKHLTIANSLVSIIGLKSPLLTICSKQNQEYGVKTARVIEIVMVLANKDSCTSRI